MIPQNWLPGRGSCSAAAGVLASLLVNALLSAAGEEEEMVHPTGEHKEHLEAHYLLPYLSESPPSSQVTVEFCNLFRIVEKPYYVIFASCWVCALMQQLIDTSRYYEERTEELSRTQKCYVGMQLITLVAETLAIVGRIDWFAGESLWQMYNLYVYVFVHSSVFVRSIMMSMIIWDWLLARLLGRPVFGAEYDGQGWRDWHRALLLVVIMQFGSSVFVMMLVTLTHAIPALLIYYPVFLIASAFIIKFRSWLESLGVNPDGRAGRGLVMASNSFVAVVSIQTMIASIIRVYFGAWKMGYLAPLRDDVDSRSSRVFYECHLRAGSAFKDPDFVNLFLR